MLVAWAAPCQVCSEPRPTREGQRLGDLLPCGFTTLTGSCVEQGVEFARDRYGQGRHAGCVITVQRRKVAGRRQAAFGKLPTDDLVID